jgi:PAS domain S-box-containing protein
MEERFEFSRDQFNKLFPFYICIDKHLKITSFGNSLKKILPIESDTDFLKQFYFKRPEVNIRCFDDIDSINDQLITIVSKHNPEIILRGQLNRLENKQSFLFVGTPWFGSMDTVRKFDLTIHDFAMHDPLIDLLHVLKNQEITTVEIKQLLETVNKQKDKLKQSELNYRSIVEQASDILYKCSANGNFTYVNQVGERITGYKKADLLSMNYLDLVREDYKEKVAEFYLTQVKNKISTTYFEFPIISKKGKEIWIGQSVQFPQFAQAEIELTALAIDISVRKYAEINVGIQEEKYRNIIANMNLGLLEVDNDDVIQHANQSFCEMSGYSLNELIGKRASELILDKSEQKIIKEKNEIRKHGVSDMYFVPAKNKIGEKKWWIISGAPRYNDNGELLGSVGIHLDVTQQKNLEDELKIAKSNAEKSAKAKESFLATMSHEIRTPLNAIVGITNMMQLNEASRSQENIDILSFSSNNLLSLISDILDFSKIEAGKIEFSSSTISLKQLLNGIYQTFKPACDEKNIKLNLAINPNVPEHIIGDELRLSQILNNLISNAVKFTFKGKITILVDAILSNENKTRLNFKIKDTGIGIEKNNFDTIFNTFEQANKSTSNQFGGTGLGLNITKTLVELQGGKIKLESKFKKGSIFSFYIDYKIPTNSLIDKKSTDTAHLESLSLKDKSVLIVEDNLINQKVAVSYLNYWGLKSDIANNGLEAIKMLGAKKYNLVIMDLYMPIMDGFEAIRLIRKDSKLFNIPIIALTASAQLSIMKRASEVGSDVCLTKPFDSKQLHQTILDLLFKSKLAQNETLDIEKSNVNDIHVKMINLKILKVASLDSNEFILEILNMLSEEIPLSIQKAENHLMNGEYLNFSNEIHKLKSSLLTLGLEIVRKDLNFMEEFSKKNKKIQEISILFDNLKVTWSKVFPEIEELKKTVLG